jgi:citrate lyase subunit beta/citryl-CoA lyase
MLYVPAHVERHLQKARSLQADSIIFDLQESVPASQKLVARETLKKALADPHFGYSEKVVRINPLAGPFGHDDLRLAASLDVDAILFPGIESAADVHECIAALDAVGGGDKLVMVNIETPRGVLRAEEIAASSDRLVAMILGTTDLANGLKVNMTKDRLGLLGSLSLVVLAARAYGRCVVDGPHLDLKNVEACEFACRQSRDLGFDGKTVIHPVQLTYTNDAFTPRREDMDRAQRILDALVEAERQGRSMAVVDDRLIEPSLQDWARRVIHIYERVQQLGQEEWVGN